MTICPTKLVITIVDIGLLNPPLIYDHIPYQTCAHNCITFFSSFHLSLTSEHGSGKM
jgi:hypothetical protein